MKNEFDIVYDKYCSKCHLRHSNNCEYKNCSEEQYKEWLKEARHNITDTYFDGNFG